MRFGPRSDIHFSSAFYVRSGIEVRQLALSPRKSREEGSTTNCHCFWRLEDFAIPLSWFGLGEALVYDTHNGYLCICVGQMVPLLQRP